jgi:hypothetical protein
MSSAWRPGGNTDDIANFMEDYVEQQQFQAELGTLRDLDIKPWFLHNWHVSCFAFINPAVRCRR